MHQNSSYNSKLNQIFHSSSLPMGLSTLDFTLIDLNKQAIKILGQNKEDLLGKSFLEFSRLGDLSYDYKNLEKLVNHKIDSYTIKRTFKNKEGQGIFGAINTSLVEIDKQTYILGIFISAESNDLVPLSDSSNYETLSQILSINPDIHYILDVQKKEYVYQNTDILQSYGYDLKDLGDKNVVEFLISKIDPESVDQLTEASIAFRNSQGLGKFVEVEYRFQSKNKGWRWLRAKSVPLHQNTNNGINFSYGTIQDITAKKKIEERLKSQENFITDVTQLLPNAITVFDAQTLKIIFHNLQGKSFLAYDSEDWIKNSKAQKKSGWIKYLKDSSNQLKQLSGKDEFITEAILKDKDGEEVWMLLRSKIFKKNNEGEADQILIVASDITQYKLALDRIDKSKQTISAILEAIPDLLMVIDDEGFYRQVFEGVNFKVSGDESIVGKSIFERLSPENAKNLLKLIKECIQTGDLKPYDFRHEFKDGSSAYYSAFISKLNEREVNVLARDITGPQKLKLALDEKVKQLSVQNEQMEDFIAKNSELERFAYILSHDLKEPLRSINAISELIQIELEGQQNSSLDQLLTQLTSHNIRMQNLVQGVLDYSKVDSNLQNQTIDLDEIVQSIISDLQVLIVEKNVQFNLGNLNSIQGDASQIRQLFQNLISNAIKFNDSNDTLIEVGSTKINDRLVYYIKDNGIGVPDEFKESIFNMFKRVHRYQDFPGQGLGLSICKKIIDRHNGKIWIENNENGGATFSFTLA
ncbi:MAG: PAS domain S-box protein [Chitinophagales bacterium]|nr:PAS domain S-box protein [Chitinophagales bacterium]